MGNEWRSVCDSLYAKGIFSYLIVENNMQDANLSRISDEFNKRCVPRLRGINRDWIASDVSRLLLKVGERLENG